MRLVSERSNNAMLLLLTCMVTSACLPRGPTAKLTPPAKPQCSAPQKAATAALLRSTMSRSQREPPICRPQPTLYRPSAEGGDQDPPGLRATTSPVPTATLQPQPPYGTPPMTTRRLQIRTKMSQCILVLSS